MKSRRGNTPPQPRCKANDLGILQSEAENAAKVLKAARTVAENARQAEKRAEAAYAVAQKALIIGVEQVQTATKV